MQSRSKIGFIFIVVYLSLLSFGTLIQRGTSVTSGNYPHLQFTFTYDNQTTFSTDVITINWSYSLSGGTIQPSPTDNFIANFTIYSPKGNVLASGVNITYQNIESNLTSIVYNPSSEGFVIGTSYTFQFTFLFYTYDSPYTFKLNENYFNISYNWDTNTNTTDSTTPVVIVVVIGMGIVLFYSFSKNRKLKEYCDPTTNPMNFSYDPNCSKERIKRGLPY